MIVGAGSPRETNEIVPRVHMRGKILNILTIIAP
jgi:hypothetical protein